MSASVALMPGLGGSLESLISPMTADEFFDRHCGKSFVHIPGTQGRFSSLAPWPQLNRILEEHRLKPPRMKLYQTGQEIDAHKYLRSPEGEDSVLKVAEFTSLLAN